MKSAIRCLLVSGLLLVAPAGCIVPFADVHIVPPHPDADETVEVVGLRGYRPVLEDGRVVTLAGLDFSTIDPLLTDDVRRDLESSLVGRRFLVRGDPNGPVRLIEVNSESGAHGTACLLASLLLHNYRSPDIPVVGLIPIFIRDKPIERDQNAYLLYTGLARLNKASLGNVKNAEEYVISERQARADQHMIWMDDDMKVAYLSDQRGSIDKVRALLARGASPRGRDGYGSPALVNACMMGNTGLARLLVQAGARPEETNSFGLTALHAAAVAGDPNLCQFLLNHGADLEAETHKGYNPLELAISEGCPGAIPLLVDKGLSPKGLGIGNLIGRERADVISLLLAEGASMEVDILRIDRIDTDLKPNPDPRWNIPLLQRAALMGDAETISVILQAGANPNESDRWGHTPLHSAVCRQKDRESVVRLLLEAGADPTLENFRGVSPIELARDHDFERLAEKMATFKPTEP